MPGVQSNIRAACYALLEKAQDALGPAEKMSSEKTDIIKNAFHAVYAADKYNTMEGAKEYIATLDELQKCCDDDMNASGNYVNAYENYYTLVNAIYGAKLVEESEEEVGYSSQEFRTKIFGKKYCDR